MGGGGRDGRKHCRMLHTAPFCGSCRPSSGSLAGRATATVDPEKNEAIDRSIALFAVSIQKI